MQLIFKREVNSLTVEIKDGTSTIPFNYVEMIKKILVDKRLEETIYQGEISEQEKQKINEMVIKINNAIPESEGIDTEEINEDSDLPF